LISKPGACFAREPDQKLPTTNAPARNRIGGKKIEGTARMSKATHGSTLESFLEAEGIFEEATIAAVKSVIAWQLAQEMAKKGITKARMAAMMKTSRAQLDRILDPGKRERDAGDAAARRRPAWPQAQARAGVNTAVLFLRLSPAPSSVLTYSGVDRHPRSPTLTM
jgi:hypothetical protein